MSSSVAATDTSSINWETLANVIAEGKCVLFLGPEATVNYFDKDRQKNFLMQLLQDHSDEIHSYHQEDGLFVFSKQEAIFNVSTEVKKFYGNDFTSSMLTKLAQMPFHFIVSLSTDRSLQKEMVKQHLSFKEDYYHVIKERTPELPSPETPPLIYHLLGVTSETDTIIVSHGQMYNFIRSFLGGTKLPQSIKTAMNFENAKSLIFLGVNFDKWYFQLMLNMLGVDASSYNCLASIQGGASGLSTIWERYFRIHFVPHLIDEFVDRLFSIFKEKDQLRKAATVEPIQRVYKLSNFIKYLQAAFSGSELDTFFISYFYEVYNDFTSDQGRSVRINKLLEYVQQHDRYDFLLKQMKEENPVRFEENAPYFE